MCGSEEAIFRLSSQSIVHVLKILKLYLNLSAATEQKLNLHVERDEKPTLFGSCFLFLYLTKAGYSLHIYGNLGKRTTGNS